jgi:hypothetical protein
MKSLIKILTRHSTHSVEVVETPTKFQYAKLSCIDCGDHRGSQFLMWLGPDELFQMGHLKSLKQREQMIADKKPVRNRLKNEQRIAAAKKNTRWAQTKTKEKQFYHSYQPQQQKFGTSFLLGDRLTLAGRYTGNPLALIPINYLKTLIATDTRLPNSKDREIIRQHISIRQTGSYPAPLEAV